MTIWAKKKCTLAEWDTVQARIAVLQWTMKAPVDLVMLTRSVPGSELHDIFIGLPEDKILRDFSGFEEIGRSDLPAGLSIAVCRSGDFEKHFPDIAEKVGPMQR